jgi:hypothetical protein
MIESGDERQPIYVEGVQAGPSTTTEFSTSGASRQRSDPPMVIPSTCLTSLNR